MALAPALFVSHGAPPFANEPGDLGQALATFGQRLATTEAIVVISPHWQTKGLCVSGSPSPDTIDDFFGFDPALHQLRYEARGSMNVAQSVRQTLASAGLGSEIDPHRGMDHGIWIPLRHMRPQADIPVVCVSLPIGITSAQAFHLGQALAPLRQQSIMIMGSGSLTHNLHEFRRDKANVAQAYVKEFSAWVQMQLAKRDVDAIINYRALAPHAKRAHPTEEHWLPLLIALGASNEDDQIQTLSTEVRHGVLSMASFAWAT